MPNEKAAEPLSEEKLAEKKVCEVCGRARCKRQIASVGSLAWGECYALGYERKAAILTPEVLRLREAGRRMRAARDGWIKRGRVSAYWDAKDALLNAALALPFEKPSDKRNG